MNNSTNPFIAAITAAFSTELSAAKRKYPGYDPFKDHIMESHPEGKSYFLPAVEGYLRPDGGVQIVSETTPDPNTRILTLRFTAEYYDPDEEGLAGLAGPESGYIWTARCGRFVTTVPNPDGNQTLEVKVRPGHGELQFFGRSSEWTTEEENSAEATVILAKEDGQWLLATAFPGPASAHNDPDIMEALSKKEYIDTDMLPDGANDTSHVQLKSDEEFDKL